VTTWIDAAEVAASLGISLGLLRRMSRRKEYPELLHVTRGTYRVRRIDHEAWESARMTSAEMAREELQAERDRAALQENN